MAPVRQGSKMQQKMKQFYPIFMSRKWSKTCVLLRKFPGKAFVFSFGKVSNGKPSKAQKFCFWDVHWSCCCSKWQQYILLACTSGRLFPMVFGQRVLNLDAHFGSACVLQIHLAKFWLMNRFWHVVLMWLNKQSFVWTVRWHKVTNYLCPKFALCQRVCVFPGAACTRINRCLQWAAVKEFGCFLGTFKILKGSLTYIKCILDMRLSMTVHYSSDWPAIV